MRISITKTADFTTTKFNRKKLLFKKKVSRFSQHKQMNECFVNKRGFCFEFRIETLREIFMS
jgi:hypothetical protein